ncbi:glycosyltransferase family 4 protein [Shimia thalassica]|uniref:glycosyltransferase family 4 protein n=1 Tax=Shimia thalassica TaxID=1715693 RepID=UPI001C080114|nr:glycosyltransferase family 4 protein [Shimia thalassica]MBU2941216.1 glycosyltransferase family 4 protein [Shimia thalassica]MDO6503300.1 glycosyltransferase family 4 protein [Shimia thalassica]
MNTLKVLLVAPNIDGTDVGEAFVAFKWAEALAELVDLTVLSFERPGRESLAQQLPAAKVVSWPEPAWARKHERLNAMLKPAWPLFSSHVRRWIKTTLAEGTTFDIAHQLMPQAARYASPLYGCGIPYVIGPLGGALETPEGFKGEMGSASWFTKLRAMDSVRFAYDPWLRRSYSNAAVVIGVAPYVRDVLGKVPLKKFAPVLELGIEELAPEVTRQTGTDTLNLLHVGRGVRTKGLRDVIRALAQLKDRPDITLTSAGAGEEIDLCRKEAEELGVADRVTFLGRIPRDEVEDLYRKADVFAFPSFREPAGGVLYEAMRWGLPIIAAQRGGPDWIVDDTCGIKLSISTPEALARDLADAIRTLADDPEQRLRLGQGSREKVAREGLWPTKAKELVNLYESLV